MRSTTLDSEARSSSWPYSIVEVKGVCDTVELEEEKEEEELEDLKLEEERTRRIEGVRSQMVISEDYRG